MRILVVGAGAIGGYFGGRLLQAHRDVTFLVRRRRAAELAEAGLIVKSPFGDIHIHRPPTVLAVNLVQKFDLILLSSKAYDLAGAMDSLAPAVGPDTMVLPLLNGMRHLDLLDQRFGRLHILGGQCVIAATLDAQGTVVHLNDIHSLTFGERDQAISERIGWLASTLNSVGFDSRLSEDIVREMWEKWVFLATLAGVTCLMRASVGDIMAAQGGHDLIRSLLDECCTIAKRAGHPPQLAFLAQARATLTARDSSMTASMLRDIEANRPVEADHILGDLLQRSEYAGADRNQLSPLAAAFAHLKAYEARRLRTLTAPPEASE
jgi:2-dehydropantoate 2-reductase